MNEITQNLMETILNLNEIDYMEIKSINFSNFQLYFEKF